eukprot:TRINITY_DN6892_c0_g1_i1.p1 TRINITY_DN6892_c0_g1~~TRINITY_DN6892_c0_g1_i1.p1  ORF type:complete len:683 (-),score=171.14 TRINITY_DN6892_c0_g1_i1:157-2205(-)
MISTEEVIKFIFGPIDNWFSKINADENIRNTSLIELEDYLKSCSKESGEEKMTQIISVLGSYINQLIKSTSIVSKIEGIKATGIMIKVISTENTSIIAPVVANVLRVCLSGNDPTVLKLSSKCLGELSKIENTLVTDCIVFELGLAIEWLRDNYEFRRLAAILILREVSINASTFFYRFIKDYFDGMWPTLRDSKPEIFEAAREVLRESLKLVGERGQASQHYKNIFEDVRTGLKSNTPQVVHGSILALFELLRNPQDNSFMQDKFASVCSTVINLKDSKDKRISMTILQLIPQLATYDEQLFKEKFLEKVINHMLDILKKSQKETEVVLGSIGDLAIVLPEAILPFLKNIFASVMPFIISASKKAKNKTKVEFLDESLQCLRQLASAVKKELSPLLLQNKAENIDALFNTEITQTLIDTAIKISQWCPECFDAFETRILQVVSIILSGKTFTNPGTPSYVVQNKPTFFNKVIELLQKGQAEKYKILALKTLRDFKFSVSLNDFVNILVEYMDEQKGEVRKEAILTCVKLLVQNETVATSGQFALTISKVIQKLLIASCSEPESSLRKLILELLDTKFDFYLSQQSNLNILLPILNDSEFEIRDIVVLLLGRLCNTNPSLIVPKLRLLFSYLLEELKIANTSDKKEICCNSITNLVKYPPRSLLKQYIDRGINSLSHLLSEN